MGATSTISAADQIVGGAGTDTLNLTYSGAFAHNGGIPAASISGVEVINVRNVTGNALTGVDLSLIPGVTAFNSDRSTGAITATNVAATTSLGIVGNGTVTNGALTATYVAGTTAATLNVSGGTTAGAVAVNGNADALLKTLTINSTGGANTLTSIAAPAAVTAVNINAATNLVTGGIDLTAAASTITVTGAATLVDLGTLDVVATTVAAAGMTAGGIKATLSTLSAKVTGGAGNDTITTAGVQTGAVDAGAGTGDRLILAATGDAAAASAAKFTNFEVLRAGAFSVDASLFTGITSVEVGGAASAFTNMTAGQAAAVTAGATATGGTFTLANSAGTADVLTVALTNETAAAVATKINLTTATIDGFETLNVGVNSGLATAMTAAIAAGGNIDLVGFTSASTLKTINVTGAYDFGIDLANAVKVTTLDLSGNTGGGSSVTLAANTGALTVTGTGATDLVTLATVGTGGTQTINTGLGNDTITGTQAQIAVATINGGGNTTAGDTLTVSDTGTITIADNSFTNVTGIEKIALGATTGLTFSVGGYANALATANGGVLDVTAANLAVTTGAVSVDASGLGAANSLKLSLTNADATASAGSIAVTMSQGADNITIVQAGAGNLDTITISGGTAALAATTAKTIDLSGVTTGGAIAVTTGAGADVIKASALVGTYTAGAGADTITLVAADGAAQTLTLSAANASTTTAFDKISNFQMVATNGDLLDFATTVVLTQANLLTGAAGWAVTTGVATKASATVADFIAAFAASTTAGAVAFSDGTNTWVGYSDGSASTTTSDVLVELVGTTGVTAISTTVAANTVGIV